MAEPVSSALTSKDQVTIPKILRQQLGLSRGSRVSFELVGDHIEVRAAKGKTPQQNSSFGMCWSATSWRNGTPTRQRRGKRAAARRLIESGQPLFAPKSVVLELEWVLRGYYRFAKDQVAHAFEALLQLPDLEIEDRSVVEQALAGLQKGLDFADALHHASCRRCNALASFATGSLAGPARSMNLQPRVITPQ